jgi:hypothetical protein
LNKITEKKLIYRNELGTVESAKLDCQQIAIKSFSRKVRRDSKEDIKIDYLKGFFNNEIINHQIINDKLEKCTNEEEKLKLNLFVEFVGFTISENENDPYFGSIITKFYPLGDLSEYVKRDSEAIKVFNLSESFENKSSLIDINQLIHFAEQIAIGLF